MTETPQHLEKIDLAEPIWERFFTVAPLVLVGTRDLGGAWDFAPKHMVSPIGWGNRFGFICTPRHATYRNARREQVFTVSYPKPEQVVMASLAAAPRCQDDSKPDLEALPTFEAHRIDGFFLSDSYLGFGCELERVVDGLGENSLVIGHIVEAWADRDALRTGDRDDGEVVRKVPLLAYLNPERFARIEESFSFPLPEGFRR